MLALEIVGAPGVSRLRSAGKYPGGGNPGAFGGANGLGLGAAAERAVLREAVGENSE